MFTKKMDICELNIVGTSGITCFIGIPLDKKLLFNPDGSPIDRYYPEYYGNFLHYPYLDKYYSYINGYCVIFDTSETTQLNIQQLQQAQEFLQEYFPSVDSTKLTLVIELDEGV